MPNISGGNVITSTNQIGDNVIVNADISPSAGIALSKLATDPLARANHTGTQLSSTISDFNTAVPALVSSSYPQLQLPLIQSSTIQTSNLKASSNLTGTIKIIATFVTGTITISRFLKDTGTVNWLKTHQITISTSGGQSLNVLTVHGTSVYIGYTTAGVSTVKRYDLADLTNLTSITISGTDSFALAGSAFSDGTFIYVYASANTYRQYSVSGTTLTEVTTIGYTSSGTLPQGAQCNGTNVWITDSTGGTVNIRKYPIAGGAVTSTTTYIITLTRPNALGMVLTLGSASVLCIGYIHTVESNAAVIGTELSMVAITLP